MSYSKPLPPFTFDLLYYLNRDQLERFSIVCRPLKNFIDRYFHSKPYRVFHELRIRGGSYALVHNFAYWHPNRDDYSVQQFLAGQRSNDRSTYHSFAEMRPYLGPTVRIKKASICVGGKSRYNPENIDEMESIAYLWRVGDVSIWNTGRYGFPIATEDLQPILNSPTILQCRDLRMFHAHFSINDYKVLHTVKVFEMEYNNDDMDPNHWPEFLEKPGVKPLVVLRWADRKDITNLLDRLYKDFSSAVSQNAFKIVFAGLDEELTEFRETNKTSGEKLELKKGLPAEYQSRKKYFNERSYTLERFSI